MKYSIKATKPAITTHFLASSTTLESKKESLVNKGFTIEQVKELEE